MTPETSLGSELEVWAVGGAGGINSSGCRDTRMFGLMGFTHHRFMPWNGWKLCP